LIRPKDIYLPFFAVLLWVGFYLLFKQLDLFESIHLYSKGHEDLDLDELVVVAAVFSFVLASYMIFRWSALKTELKARHAAEQNAKHARKIAEDANRAKSDFLSNISHEIRNPLNSILGFVQLLEDEVHDKQHQEYLSIVKDSSNVLLSLINDILDLSKIESQRIDLHPTAVDLLSVFKKLQLMFQVAFDQKGLDWEVCVPSDGPCLTLDPAILRQILTNLISNALKFTDTGKVSLVVEYNKTEDKPEVASLKVQVVDTGMGIAEADRERVFESFRQQRGQDLTKYPGSGLGLAISKNLAQAMSGNITYYPKGSGGSVFQLDLPDLPVTLSVPQSQPEPIKIAQRDLRDAHVLVVEDDELTRKLLDAFLSKEPFEVYHSMNGADALQVIEAVQIDLILMDNYLPMITGLELAQKIKSDARFTKIPIIGISASVMESDLKAYEAGFDSFIPKPFNQQELLSAVKPFLGNNL